jgi:chorismate mutase
MGNPATIAEWRDRIDDLDRQLVALLSQRARAAEAIGYLKRATDMPIYEPNREKSIFANVRAANPGPLADAELQHIYERIIDVMRSIQQEKITHPADPDPAASSPATSDSGATTSAPDAQSRSSEPRP